jgi:hypothetical protein
VTVSDEPSNAELGRRLDDIWRLLQPLIGRAEYTADQRAAERRLADITADIDDVRRQHTEDIRAVNERQTAAERATRQGRTHWQTLIFTGLIPAAVAAIAIWVSRGAH